MKKHWAALKAGLIKPFPYPLEQQRRHLIHIVIVELPLKFLFSFKKKKKKEKNVFYADKVSQLDKGQVKVSFRCLGSVNPDMPLCAFFVRRPRQLFNIAFQ